MRKLLCSILALVFSDAACASQPCKIDLEHSPQKHDLKLISNGLWEFNAPFIGNEKDRFAVILRNGENNVVGGVIALTRPRIKMLYIDVLWLHESMRHQGYGTQLMLAAEAEGKKLGCTHSQLETLPFQAEEFYKKLGYYRIGVVEKLYGEYDYIFMRKDL